MNAPNEKAMNSACSRRSLVSPPTESLMISNLPVSHRQAIEHDRREDDPGDREEAVGRAGERRHQRQLRRHADRRRAPARRRRASAVSAAIHAGLRRTPSMKNSTAIGIAATSADADQTAADRLIVLLPHRNRSYLIADPNP